MKKETKKFLMRTAITTAGIAGLATASHGVTRYLMQVAMDRDEPKFSIRTKEQLAGSKEKSDLINKLRLCASSLEKKAKETITITARDGTTLVGHWWPHDNARRVIIAMHGWRSVWSTDFGIIADFWHDSGSSILFAEQRGQGSSGGKYMGFGLTERFDCCDWIDWVNFKESGSIPIYLGGVSMGATTVLMAAGLDLPKNVVGVVADCGFTSPHEIWKHVVKNNLHLSYGLRSIAASELCKKKINCGPKSYSTIEALKKTNIPVMLIHGTDDNFVPIEMTFQNYKACASPKYLFIVPGADHAMSYVIDKHGYENNIRDFWNKYDSALSMA